MGPEVEENYAKPLDHSLKSLLQAHITITQDLQGACHICIISCSVSISSTASLSDLNMKYGKEEVHLTKKTEDIALESLDV